MKVHWNGREYSWRPKGKKREGSSYHRQARELLAELFPLELRLEEVSLPGTRLTADFYLPGRKLLVEVHGEQHYCFTGHFHEFKLDFYKGQHRDTIKKQWAETNGISYVELPYDKEEEWTKLLMDA